MKKSVCWAFLLTAAVLTGCGTVSHTQYRVGPARAPNSAQAVITAADRQAVVDIVKGIGAQMHWRDITDLAVVPNVLVYFQEQETESPVKMMAWTEGESIVVDLIQTPGAPGETMTFMRAKEKLLADLEQAFGKRVTITPYQRISKVSTSKAQ